MKRYFLVLLYAAAFLFAHSQKSGHCPLACLFHPDFGYESDSIDYYDPAIPFIWTGNTHVCNGIFGGSHDDFHTRKGFMKQFEVGYTVLQINYNLYKGIAGISSAFQLVIHNISLDHHYMPHRTGNSLEFEYVDNALKRNNIGITTLRIPVLTGIQTRNRYFSFQTGLSFEGRLLGTHDFQIQGEEEDDHHIHIPFLGVNWHVMANVGAFTIAFNQSLIPIFQVSNGRKAYTRSLTLGYNICFIQSFKHTRAIIKRRKAAERLF